MTSRPLRWTRGADLALLAEALLVLAVGSCAIRFSSFRRVASAAGWHGRDVHRGEAENPQMVERCRRAVNGWARRVPWQTACFQKGLALHMLLRRRGIASMLHYGVNQDQDGLSAHVWLVLDGETILGGEVAPEFTCLAVFPDPGLRPLAKA